MTETQGKGAFQRSGFNNIYVIFANGAGPLKSF